VFSDQVFRKAVGKWRLGWLADLDVNSGAHGVTRPTNDGLATGRFDFMTHFGVRESLRNAFVISDLQNSAVAMQ